MSKKLKRIWIREDDFWDFKKEAADNRLDLIDYMSVIKPKNKKKEYKDGFPFP